ncbi:uncharacterized protein LOC142973384 [Anticarsia gemmatalis]|uniref:uncharacterized protein LOC142973384 n=1 Tax=Anticarsia gemmatalis TaxID=129554 RepID=UPI003F760682
MTVSVGVFIILTLLLIFIAFFNWGSRNGDINVGVLIIIGTLGGIVGVALTVTCIVLLSRRHDNIVLAGFDNPAFDNKPTQEFQGQSANIYVKNEDKVVLSPSATSPHPSDRQMTLQRKVSLNSDYTESHYYTEIDEYFINKRNAHQQQKLQNRCDNARPHNKTGDAARPSPQVENQNVPDSSYVYDYAYGLARK